MAGQRVLIVGISTYWGAQIARKLETDPRVSYLAGIDTKPPDCDLERTEFLQADIRNPLISRLIPQTEVDTIVHCGILHSPKPGISKGAVHDVNVIGSLQLLGACEKTESLRTLVIRSSAAIYGCEPDAPSFIVEEVARHRRLRSVYQRDLGELESYFETFARRYPHVSCMTARFQPTIGPNYDSPLVRYLQRPVVPTQLGYDPRIQLLHQNDGVSALHHAIFNPVRGPVNIAGEGAISLTRMLRLLGKLTLPLAPPLFGPVVRVARRLGQPELGDDLTTFLRYGRALDLFRMREELGFKPRYSTVEAVLDFARTNNGMRLVPSVREVVADGS